MEHMGSYKESVSIYNHILKQDPLIPEVRYRCFVSKTKSDDDELPDSRFYLNQAIDLNPEYAIMSKTDGQKKCLGMKRTTLSPLCNPVAENHFQNGDFTKNYLYSTPKSKKSCLAVYTKNTKNKYYILLSNY